MVFRSTLNRINLKSSETKYKNVPRSRVHFMNIEDIHTKRGKSIIVLCEIYLSVTKSPSYKMYTRTYIH